MRQDVATLSQFSSSSSPCCNDWYICERDPLSGSSMHLNSIVSKTMRLNSEYGQCWLEQGLMIRCDLEGGLSSVKLWLSLCCSGVAAA
mmetsp:Transcript_5776/g.7675  ORF Transcript_5776/g.7675 Transcript_5776/m.7675 type:complete len:88 (-) Transcript_5776:427-690(-)